MMFQKLIADLWLGAGLKYWVSQIVAGSAWYTPLSVIWAKHKIDLLTKKSLSEVIGVFKGRVSYDWDPLHGVADFVKSPLATLDSGLGDCDDQAMLHACAVEWALGSSGWHGYIISYLADPWWLSHHFCAAISPDNLVFVVQPWPSQQQLLQGLQFNPLWSEPYGTMADACAAVVASYKAKVVAWDVRDCFWRPVQRWA